MSTKTGWRCEGRVASGERASLGWLHRSGRGGLALALALCSVCGVILCGAVEVAACTTVMMKGGGGPIIAKSYDWDHEAGQVHLNPRGLSKTGVVMPGQGPAASWTARYQSVTFNQFGREFPNGGMNEAGLVVEIMWLNVTRWPTRDERPAVNELQWIQYQLDNHATTAEVLANAEKVRVAPIHARVHYMACDKAGQCATLEYLDGALKVHAGDALPVPALTNHTYEASVKRWEAQRERAAPGGAGSLARFMRAAGHSRAAGSVEAAWAALKDVEHQQTQWQIVYEPQQGRVHFRTRSTRQVRVLSLSDFSASCRQPALALGMQRDIGGDLKGHMKPYDAAANRALIQSSVRRLGASFPAPFLDAVAAYPEALRCSR